MQISPNVISGLEKLKSVERAYQSFAKEKPEAFRLLNHSRFVGVSGDTSNYLKMSNLGGKMFLRFTELVKAGKMDGSISRDFNENRGIFTLFFMVNGFFFQISEIGPGYVSLYGMDPEKSVIMPLIYFSILCPVVNNTVPARNSLLITTYA